MQCNNIAIEIFFNAYMRNTYLQDYRLDYITVFYIRRQKEMDHNRICHYTNYSKKLQLKYFVIYVHICHRLFHPQPKNILKKNAHVILFDKNYAYQAITKVLDNILMRRIFTLSYFAAYFCIYVFKNIIYTSTIYNLCFLFLWHIFRKI